LIWLLSTLSKTERINMRVGILGSGLMGGKLGTLFARAEHEVVFAFAPSQKKLQGLARGWRAGSRDLGNRRVIAV
jgi:predicted dinucleotide-binding enzyme